MGFAEVLTIVFIVLKLTGNIAWSWWWVLSPMWIFYGLILLVILFCLLMWILFNRPMLLKWRKQSKF